MHRVDIRCSNSPSSSANTQMGRKKGGKNPEGHRAGGARSGAGRPRKAGPLTLKASIRVHAHQPAGQFDPTHPTPSTLLTLLQTPQFTSVVMLSTPRCASS